MTNRDPEDNTRPFSKRLADSLRPDLEQVLFWHGIELKKVEIEPFEDEDGLLMSYWAEIRITLLGRTVGCEP